MKFCSNCGNKLEENQSFCNKCGKQVNVGTSEGTESSSNSNDNSSTNSESSINPNYSSTTSSESNSDSKYDASINSEYSKSSHYNTNSYSKNNNSNYRTSNYTQRNNDYLYSSKKKKKSATVIILSIVAVLLLLGALVVAGYFLFKNLNININTGDSSESNANNQRISINVLSDQFSSDFMKSDNSDGYDGFNIGMSKDDIKEEFGEPESVDSMDFGEVEKYGDIGVTYDSDDTVSSVYVLPQDVSVSAFKQFHGEPTMESDGQLIYDDNSDNGFTIFINVKDGEVQSIENGYQMDRN
ncbi:zinc ribbon domain-containing protein [Staphylococcus gallinarum]|uniref:zinc ribbon domain-containing protein n=1 Tax=Staphylococcus gallinarum TaxID=1293 RepID=UPI001E49369B|nr:zinc ribbon domain-containing protein [Staphylococcus gallinarum]MCD8920107.1 zinc ribbon domain-containing protein [Staphylococcus gallinarum]MEB6277985.1 zinc ribbon domain-containing protein [Staphylococcus gallinarum]UEH00129.1 zinc ribbon domain-containing protein [Staphylococcus gallinarum]